MAPGNIGDTNSTYDPSLDTNSRKKIIASAIANKSCAWQMLCLGKPDHNKNIFSLTTLSPCSAHSPSHSFLPLPSDPLSPSASLCPTAHDRAIFVRRLNHKRLPANILSTTGANSIFVLPQTSLMPPAASLTPKPQSSPPGSAQPSTPNPPQATSPPKVPPTVASKLSQASPPFLPSPPSRGASPSKMSDFEFIGEEEVFFGGEVGDMGDVGDETVCSNFSDVTIGQFGSAGALNCGGNAGPGKRSPVKSRPQTPTNRQPISTAATPKTTRPRSRHNNMQSSPDPPASPSNHNQTANLLLDFTQQFDAITSRPPMPTTPLHRRTKSASPTKGGKASPSKFALPPATPTEKKFFNLLDFSPGALASPRSVPSITPREVDQLKASFASQLSQLRAELNGREAEIIGLRDALRQSEVRYADANNGMKQQEDEFEEERNNWQNAKVELRQLFEAERVEKETLVREMEKREDELRMLRERAEDALKELADAKRRVTYAEDEAVRAKKEAETAWKHAEKTQPSSSATPSSPDSTNVQTEVEKVARELHSLYKAKHETKVTALKKSYEARWEKKVIALQTELDTQKRRCEELEAQIQKKNEEEMTADIKYSASNAEELAALRGEVKRLGDELKAERREKGELVGAVEELLSIQASSSAAGGGGLAEEREKVSRRVARVSGVGFGGSIGSNNGLKSEIERMGGGARK